jgi:hypothetical protein
MQTAANSMQQRALTQYTDSDVKSITRVQAQCRMKSARRVLYKMRLLGAGTLKEILNLKDDDEDDDDWESEIALSKKDIASVRLMWSSILDRQLNCCFEAFSSLLTTGAPRLSSAIQAMSPSELAKPAVKFFDKCIDIIDDLEVLRPELQKLGLLHKSKGVDMGIFQEFGGHLINAVLKYCPEGKHPYTRVAWTTFYGVITNMMMNPKST